MVMSSNRLRECIQCDLFRNISPVLKTVYTNIVNEYDKEIPQSQTADNPMASEEEHTTITRHQEDKLSKATSCLFPTKMIAKLEWT